MLTFKSRQCDEVQGTGLVSSRCVSNKKVLCVSISYYCHPSLPSPIPLSHLTLRLLLLKLQSVGRFTQSTLQPLLLLQLHELVLGLGGAFSAKGREGGSSERLD